MFTQLFKHIRCKFLQKHSNQNRMFSSAPVTQPHTKKLDSDQVLRNTMWNYLRLALKGNQEAQYQLGLAYLNGEYGLNRNYTHAKMWLEQAEYQGHTDAKNQLEKAFDKISFS